MDKTVMVTPRLSILPASCQPLHLRGPAVDRELDKFMTKEWLPVSEKTTSPRPMGVKRRTAARWLASTDMTNVIP